ncbi:hypothetical protein LZ554_001723 [Drepanopeziza brunnea f. sp. 'monogermtubi']|nr:hypothetical protein LZ554_001723 [Drepanopeziza brunnea f. sp. 'monogermtubi']
MPPPATVPALGWDQDQPISALSIGLDAIVLHSWRDNSNFGTSDPEYPYFGMELQICCWKSASPTSHILARYTGGKLKKDALYQLSGRFFIDTSAEGGKSYLHIDEAVRFQGPGTLRSYRKPQFLLVGEVVSVLERALVMRWVTRDPYRREMTYEQSAVVALEKGLSEKERLKYEGKLCVVEARMEGPDHRNDWVCQRVRDL